MAQGGHDGGGVRAGFAGPWCWLACAIAGAVVGLALAWALPNDHHDGPPPAAVRRPGVVEHGANGESRTLVPPPLGGADGGTGGGAAPAPASGAGAGAGAGAGEGGDEHGHGPATPLWLCLPFALLLLSIATMPFINEHFWHRHYPDFAFFFGSIVAAYYLAAMGDHGVHALRHAMTEYYSFIALVGGLYVVSGGILIRFRGRGTPRANTAVLAAGAVLANLVGTTGASVLLIRPYMRMNEGRLRPLHIVFFIFIVSNCGGCLTPIGDPPLYLGFLKGVPFFWTMTHLWPMWLATVGMLLGAFYAYDRRVQRRSGARAPAAALPPAAAADTGTHGAVTVAGRGAIAALVLLVGGVMIDPALRAYAGVEGIPVGATFQVVVAAAAWRLARREIHEANRFDFHPVREVGLLFVGIFATMIPALEYLSRHGAALGLASPGGYFLGTGVLSAVLDNAPTYLSFVQLSFSVLGLDVSHEGVRRVIDHAYTIVQADGRTLRVAGADLLAAISLGAVFFGAMTYIGNGPNFMVKSIADASGKVKMPSFFGYAALAAAILGPVLLVVWAVFIR